MRKLILTTILSLSLLMPLTAFSGELADVTLPDTAEVAGQQLVLNGMALRDVLWIDVYVAGLYLPAKSSDEIAIVAADTPWKVVLHFVRDVDGEDIAEAWDKGLEKNTPNASDALKAQFAELNAKMADIKDGEDMIFTYVPGTGVSIEESGQDKGVIAGMEFSDALLRCWIGPDPDPGESFKEGLLGLDD